MLRGAQFMATQAPPQVGERLGHYQLTELLAVGGMGMVFRAYEEALDRQVAVKVLSPELAADEQFANQFISEARAAATMSHANIVHVYNVGEDRGLLFFAMELVEGDNLDTLLRSVRQFNIAEAVQLIRQAALGLQHAHQRGIIHGDIKPANLVVTFNGVLKVTDFGLAKRTTAAGASDFGTPEYVSPEIIKAQPSDHRSDIYALGATLYHLLAGQPPFTGPTPEAVMEHHLHAALPPVQKLNMKVPPSVSRIISVCMAKKPGERYQHYEDLITALDAALAALTSTGKRKRESAPGSLFAVVFVIVLAISGAAFYFYVQRQQAQPPAPPIEQTQPAPPKAVEKLPNEPPTPVKEVTAEDEALAMEAAAALQAQAEPLIAAGKFSEALAIYRQWPLQPNHAKTRATQVLREQRTRLNRLVETEWDQWQKQTLPLRQEHKYAEALTLCDQFRQKHADFSDCVKLVQRETEQIRGEEQRRQADLLAEQRASEQRLQARLNELRDQVAKQIVALQWEKAREELRAAVKSAEAALQPRIVELQRVEVDSLIALRQAITDRVKAKPGPTLTLATRTGQIEGQVLADSDGRLALGLVLTHGVASTPIPWDALPPASVLRFYSACRDPNAANEQLAYAVLCAHYALQRAVRLDDARREVLVATEKNPASQPALETFLTRLADLERRLEQETALAAAQQALEQKAAFAWSAVESALSSKEVEAVVRELAGFLNEFKDTEVARQHRADIERMRAAQPNTPVAAFRPVSLGRAARVQLISTSEGDAPDKLESGATLATTGWLRGKGIARHGLPEDGKLVVAIGDQRVPFDLQFNRPDAIVLLRAPGGGSRVRNMQLQLQNHRGNYDQIAVLFTAAQGNSDLDVVATYDGGFDPSVFTFRAWNWQHIPTEVSDKRLAVVTTTATDKSRVSLGARLFTLNGNHRLNALRFVVPEAEDYSRDTTIAVLGVSLLPAAK